MAVASGSAFPGPAQREPIQVAVCPGVSLPASTPDRVSGRVCITVGSCLPESSKVGNLTLLGHKLSAGSNIQYQTSFGSKYGPSPPGTGVLHAPKDSAATLTVGSSEISAI